MNLIGWLVAFLLALLILYGPQRQDSTPPWLRPCAPVVWVMA